MELWSSNLQSANQYWCELYHTKLCLYRKKFEKLNNFLTYTPRYKLDNLKKYVQEIVKPT